MILLEWLVSLITSKIIVQSCSNQDYTVYHMKRIKSRVTVLFAEGEEVYI